MRTIATTDTVAIKKEISEINTELEAVSRDKRDFVMGVLFGFERAKEAMVEERKAS